MSDRSPRSRGPAARFAVPRAVPAARPQPSWHVRALQDRRRAVIIGGIMVATLMIGIVAVTAIQLTRRTEPPLADVMRLRDEENCRRQSYDNQTSYLTQTQRRCENPVVFDVNDLPPPSGTIRRLDDISKSFSSR